MIFTPQLSIKPNLIISKGSIPSYSPELTNTYATVFEDSMYVIENNEREKYN
ncbi:hypothetical protein [Flavobacterium sp. ACAM 123]|jgi:hypothetical protein|uniref:hypothetical protein n=1 Tax=Flavobacterium sp. ACAM 123 TaxID=1189620 RepID=UPI0002E509EF|nr:hypothetical protein [Flavobacterium sp. ACAM 123]